MADRVRCDLCDRELAPHAQYIVRIDVFADPSIPPVSSAELASTDFDQELDALLREMEGLSADDLQDQVHRRFEYRICRPCQIRFLANPFGKPRKHKEGEN
jgi:hypothetical protein